MKTIPLSVVKRSQEFYSFIVRLALGLCIALFVWLGISGGNFSISYTTYSAFAGFYFITTLILGIDLFRNAESSIRRYITLFFDLSCTSFAILLTGGGESEFMLIYIWLYIAYGTRYGLPYLLSAVLIVMLEYNLVLLFDSSWFNNPLRSSAQIFVLIVMPIYLYSMVKQLHTARKEAEQATREKSNFLAIMSHEIRTPMSGIIGTAYLLQKTQQNKQQKQYTEALINGTQALHTLIDDILDFSKIEAKKLHLQYDAFDLHKTINEVVSVLTPNLDKQCLVFSLAIDPEVPACFIGDKQRIRQVLFNLLGNAIKFTEQGKVTLQVCIEQDAIQDSEKVHLHFDIKDTGIGIGKKQLSSIFDSFTQAEKPSSHQYHGTGLGTTISKQLVELMGGQIGVTSELGKGSHFWFSLSLPVAQKEGLNVQQHCDEESADTLSNASLTILIAEDEDINAMVLKNFLQDIGHKAIRVSNGTRALYELSETHYDLAFMDMHMPEMNGPEATKLWREHEATGQRMPIIALTAHATIDDRELCLSSGMDDFITKPISPEQLSAAIEKFCSRS